MTTAMHQRQPFVAREAAGRMPASAWHIGRGHDIFLSNSLWMRDERSATEHSLRLRSLTMSKTQTIPEESMSTRRFFLVAMLGFAAAACGGSKSRSAPVPQPRTTLRVENQGFADMTIYAIRSGQRVRLGNAPGNSTMTFTIPSNLIFGATPLRFLADPIGSNRTPVSDEITVQPGDQVRLVIPPR